ncbi:MAG: hypothetical protein PVH24_04340 [Candidatus Zixiibacteriota bacterium]|jgi:hypothetical protein
MKKFAIVSVMGLIAFLAGCGPKKQPVEEAPSSIYPYDLKVEPNDGMLKISWKRAGKGLISGYDIYITPYSLRAEYPNGDYPESIKPFNQAIFPGDTNPEDNVEHYDAEGLENGVKYYVSVRIVFPSRAMSRATAEVAAVPGPRGEIKLQARYQGEHDGYSFMENTYTRADASDNDVFFYSVDNVDYLASPNRLGFLRESKFMVLPLQGDIDQVTNKVNNSEFKPSEERVEVSKGDWVLMMTQDDRHVLLHVLEFSGRGKERAIMLYFAVSALKGEIFF